MSVDVLLQLPHLSTCPCALFPVCHLFLRNDLGPDCVLLTSVYLAPSATQNVQSVVLLRIHGCSLCLFGSWVHCSFDRRHFLKQQTTIKTVELMAVLQVLSCAQWLLRHIGSGAMHQCRTHMRGTQKAFRWCLEGLWKLFLKIGCERVARQVLSGADRPIFCQAAV